MHIRFRCGLHRLGGGYPLYRLGSILANHDKPLLVVEGEGTAETAVYLFGDRYEVMTAIGGAGKAGQTDWNPARSRDVVIWSDADEPGRTHADEFIRRFLLHVLPRGFTWLRHYGFLANRCRARKLALCRDMLGQPVPEPREPETAEEMKLRLTGIDITVCRQCERTLQQILILEPRHGSGMAAMKTGQP